MVRRSASSSFVGGAYVFPGGAVEEIDRGELATQLFGPEGSSWYSAAVRETIEEVGLVVPAGPSQPSVASGLRGVEVLEALQDGGYRFDQSRLVLLSNWVTPRGQPRRFDTRFFLTDAPRDAHVAADDVEVHDAVWVRPTDALAHHTAHEWMLVPPTVETLRWLVPHEEPSTAMFTAAASPTPRIAPRMVFGDDGSVTILLPGDTGYEDAEP